MSFQRKANSIQSKLHLSEVSQPVLIGVLSLVVCLLIAAGFMFVRVFLQGDFSFDLNKGDVSELRQKESSDHEDAVDNPSDSSMHSESIFVHMSGAVVNPGVVELPKGSRGIDAVEAAGGFTDDAVIDSLNLAREVQDGEQLVVAIRNDSGMNDDTGSLSSGASSVLSGNQLVNLNTASLSDLVTLPGVGESTAKKIIDDRNKNGMFKKIEDLKRVSGIGEKKFEALKDYICVQ